LCYLIKMPGWKDIPGKASFNWIYEEFLESNPRRNAVVVEVGVALGKSISYASELFISAGREDIQLYAVDSWAGVGRNYEQQRWADEHGGDFSLFVKVVGTYCPKALERIRVVRMASVAGAKAIGASVGPADLVVLDAGHDYGSVRADLDAWIPVIRHPGGWIGGDDYDAQEFPGVVQACEETFGKKHVIKSGEYTLPDSSNRISWPGWLFKEEG
jgi:hypothetical protein